jgi:hypothetical protein
MNVYRPASWIVTLAFGVLAACATLPGGRSGKLAPGTSTMHEVRAAMGNPSAVWFDRDGLENWDYDANRQSYFAYSARFDGEGRLEQWRQLRTPEAIARIVPGQSTVRDVRESCGEPHLLYVIRGDTHWEWRVLNANRNPRRLVVQFGPDGLVKSAALYLPPEGGALMGR